MSLLASDPVASDLPLRDLAAARGAHPAGMVFTMEQAMADRWFAVDVLLIPATRPGHWTERAIAGLSRAAGPVALALGFAIPVAALLR